MKPGRRRRIMLYVVVSIVACVLIVRAALAWIPGKTGLVNGELGSCPNKPNCVCSKCTDPEHHVEPLRFEDDAQSAWRRLLAAIGKLPRTRIVKDQNGYLHATSISLLVGYVDDLECLVLPEEKLIHLRSASRVGYSDLGVNRQRIEALRVAFQSDH